jgi:hypothetical protein
MYNAAIDPRTKGTERVRLRVITITVKRLRSFASTIIFSERGNVINTSIVFALFSSLILRMERAGINMNNNHGATLKKGLRDADPTTKTSLMNKYPKKSAKTIGTEYPTGEFKSCMSSFL